MMMGMGLSTLCGVDCDDADSAVYPGQVEMADSVDDNCDSNVDDMLNTRTEPELFEYDLLESGWTSEPLFDFEGSFSGDDGSSLYSLVGLSMFGSDRFRVIPNVCGT